LDDILAPRLLNVPAYQRGYAWGSTQLEEFWEDLDLLNLGQRHYTGTVVLQQGRGIAYDEDREIPLGVFEVVDGQQRLTTCILLLHRLFGHLEQLGDADAPAQRRRLLTACISGVRRPKLQLGPDLAPYWQDVVLGGYQPIDPPTLATQRRLSQAGTYFDRRIEEQRAVLSDDDFRRWLRQLAGKVTGSLQFTIYTVGDEAEAGVIFETLNQRGKDLTELEKVKNYLLFLATRLPDARREELGSLVNESWKRIFTNLGSADLATTHEDQLLRAHWLATQNPRQLDWRQAKSVKERFHRRRYANDLDLLFTEVSAYARSLREASAAYRDVVVDSLEAFGAYGDLAGDVRRVSRQLRQAGVVAVFAPLLLAGRLRFPTDGQAYGSLVDLCERYSVRVYLVAERRSNAGQTRLYTLAHDLYQSGNLQAALSGLTERIAYFASDQELFSELINVRRNWYAKPGHKYFLYQYELHLLNGVAPALPFEHFTSSEFRSSTTEHILPQTPEDSCWLDRFSESDRGELTHALGNLSLTYDNSVYSNYCFARKRDGVVAPSGRPACYTTSSLKQEQELATYEDWTPQTVTDRQSRLADWAMQRWAIAASGPVSIAGQEDDEVTDADADPMLGADPLALARAAGPS
jgi:hypothetical protein